jgi:hypothetical protein
MHQFKEHQELFAFHFHLCSYTGKVKVEAVGEYPINPIPGKRNAILIQSPSGIPHHV